MNKASVLLTRPEGFNASLTAALRQSGYRVIERPLMSVQSLPESVDMRQTSMNLDLFDAVVFISRNAVIHGMPHLQAFWPQWPQRLMWCAVGDQTAQELAYFDIDAVYPDKAGSKALYEVIDRKTGWQGIERVLVVRGTGGLETLRDALNQRGIHVDYLEVYRRSPLYWPTLPQELSEVDAVIVSAGEVVDTLCGSLNENQVATLKLIVPSPRVADIARAKGIGTVMIASDQTDETLVHAVKEVLAQS